MKWFIKWYPGFMCVSHKPRPFGNKQHNIACVLTTIPCRAQSVEGKYRPDQLCAKKLYDPEKSVGLMLQMCDPIFATGNDVVVDNGFFWKGYYVLGRKGCLIWCDHQEA